MGGLEQVKHMFKKVGIRLDGAQTIDSLQTSSMSSRRQTLPRGVMKMRSQIVSKCLYLFLLQPVVSSPCMGELFSARFCVRLSPLSRAAVDHASHNTMINTSGVFMVLKNSNDPKLRSTYHTMLWRSPPSLCTCPRPWRSCRTRSRKTLLLG